MVVWQRHLQTVLRHIGRRTEHYANARFSYTNPPPPPPPSSSRIFSSIASGEVVPSTQTQWRRQPGNVATPLYQYLQRMWISSSRKLLTESTDAAPMPSPLTPLLPSSTTGTSESQKSISKPSKVQAILKGIKQSPKKVNLVAALVRGMRVEDALLQLQVTVKRAAKTVYQVIHSARANATHNHGLDPDKLLVAEAFVGKGLFKKRLRYHGKGKCGLKIRPECRLTVVLREITAEEEAEIAKLKVSNFRKLTKREKRLVPHKLIETTPIWNRKGKGSGREANAMAA